MLIKKYEPQDSTALFLLLEGEGEEWSDYWQGSNRQKYEKALTNSLCYVLCEDETPCAYLRCRDDDGYGIYIYDLLVDKAYRGRSFGRLLIDQVCKDFPHDPVYVMSDADPYYKKQGYEREGSIFVVQE